MCGIYITNIPYVKKEVVEKLESFQFRGPNNLGYEKIDALTLGHLRLSILDLDMRSNQPFRFEHLAISFNGEIYNFESIKVELIALGYSFETTSDTEVLIKGYKEWGAALLPKLNGMFAFAIYDSKKQEVFCARDRLGVKPFFYYWKDGAFEIASQLRPLINKNSKISEEGISIYLDCGYIPSPLSAIEYVYKLPPGNYMTIDLIKQTKTLKEYWNLKPVVTRDISYEDAKRELHDLLKDAVKIRMRSDVPLGSFLSGGIDSALISSIASNLSENPINTFTIGFDDPKFDESKVAKQFAEIIGSNHIETKCEVKDVLSLIPMLAKVYDEPFADSSALPSLLLNSVTKSHATVALSGDGGDESFLGYEHFDSVAKFEPLVKIPYFLRYGLSKFTKGLKNYSSILSVKSMDEFIQRRFIGYDSLQKDIKLDWLRHFDNFKTLTENSIQKTADLNIKLWLENDSNVKVDRASMAYAVEVRSPFLDYRVVEYARSLPVSFRFESKENRKRILKDILEQYIDRATFTQPKKGFAIPIGNWLRNELKSQVLQSLSDEFLAKVPNLNIEKFKNKMNAHFQEKEDNSFPIWKLFVLSLWYKEFDLLIK